MPTQRESIYCHEMEQIKCLVEDPCLEVQQRVLHNTQTVITCVYAKLCSLSPCTHIYITTKMLMYLMMKTGLYLCSIGFVYHEDYLLLGNFDTWHTGN